ncbi:MAG TPA: bifunctional folylpolyglutamate synthase/dihydrofolate synthase [Syntrophobacteraceae bacterium]|nr:bifunctional folylpolyglutamate synthase/dihydrofolate synthase [Syntrophobacteraceae bacterium]
MLRRYQESIDYLFGLQKHGIKFGLNRTENLLEKLGNPHERLRCIHIAGTNGKGSTAAMLATVLQEQNYRVGLYTSPHLVRFTERFRIDGVETRPETILDVFEQVRGVLDEREPPTFFEVVTAMGLLCFAQENVDWAVVEVGMGGRLDATNVICPRASVITNISFDHQEFLGATLTSIAREKAGIIKEDVPLVCGARQPAVQGVIKTTCYKRHAALYRLGVDFRVRQAADSSFQYQGMQSRWSGMRLNLDGAHQLNNAAVALATLDVLGLNGEVDLDEAAIHRGLLKVHWPARLEVLQQHPLIVLDGAHNPQGAECLRDALKRDFSYRRLHLVVGVMRDKDLRGILRRLLPIADTVTFTRPRYERAADPEQLKALSDPYNRNHSVIADVASAIQHARRLATPDDLICITGSLYFAGEVKELFGEPTTF